MNDSEGIVSVESRFEVAETLDRLAETVTGLGLYVVPASIMRQAHARPA